MQDLTPIAIVTHNQLKQNAVAKEIRCQFVGYEHDTVNSTAYSKPQNMQYLLYNVAINLDHPGLDFNSMKYSQGQFTESLSNLCAKKAKQEAHKTARKKRNIATK